MIDRGRLSILRLIKNGNATVAISNGLKVPFWVPCFDLDGRRNTVNVEYPFETLFQADEGTFVDIERIKCPKTPDILSAVGVLIGNVDCSFPVKTVRTSTKPATLDHLGRAEHLRKLSDRLWKVGTSRVPYRTGETHARALSLTLIAGVDYNSHRAANDPKHDANFSAFVRRMAKMAPCPSIHELVSLTHGAFSSAQQAKSYQYQLLTICENRSFFTTSTGLGSMGTRDGDCVCVLFGLDIRWFYDGELLAIFLLVCAMCMGL